MFRMWRGCHSPQWRNPLSSVPQQLPWQCGLLVDHHGGRGPQSVLQLHRSGHRKSQLMWPRLCGCKGWHYVSCKALHSLTKQWHKCFLSRFTMVHMSRLLSWVKCVAFPGLRHLHRHKTSSMFASDRIILKTIEDSVPGSRKVSVLAVILRFRFILVPHLLLFWFPACGSTIITDDVGGAIASPRYPYTYPPNQNCSWIIRAQEPCKSDMFR